MPDISMCNGTNKEAFPVSVEIGITEEFNCPLREKCCRYKAKPSYRQSYFIGIPYDIEKKECEHYWENINRAQTVGKAKLNQNG